MSRAVIVVCRVLAFSVVAIGLTLGLSLPFEEPADAGRKSSVRVQFIGWSGVNPDTFAVKIVDANKGNRLEIRQLANPIPLLKVKVKPNKEREVLASKQFEQWSFIIAGAPGLKAPNGWEVFGQREGGLLRIGLSNGRDSMELGRVQARSDSASGTFATATVKNAYWAPDSMRVVVIVNQRNSSGGWSMDRDDAHGFKIGK